MRGLPNLPQQPNNSQWPGDVVHAYLKMQCAFDHGNNLLSLEEGDPLRLKLAAESIESCHERLQLFVPYGVPEPILERISDALSQLHVQLENSQNQGQQR